MEEKSEQLIGLEAEPDVTDPGTIDPDAADPVGAEVSDPDCASDGVANKAVVSASDTRTCFIENSP